MNSQLILLNKMLILSMLTNKFNVIQTKKKSNSFFCGGGSGNLIRLFQSINGKINQRVSSKD